jgi:hypothetical protein
VLYRLATVEDAEAIDEFAAAMDWGWRCTQLPDRPERTHPPRRQIDAHLASDRSTTWVAEDNGTLVAYLICRETDDGCQGRWYGITPGPPAEMAEITKTLMDLAVARYGRLWGRLTNPAVHRLFRDVPGVSPTRDPEVLSYEPQAR